MQRFVRTAPALLVVLLGCTAAPVDSSADADLGASGGVAQASVGRPPACVTTSARTLDPARCSHERDTLDDALERVGLERCSAGLSAENLALSKLDATDPRMLGSVRAAQQSPLALPPLGLTTATALDAAMNSSFPATRAILAAATLRDAPLEETCVDTRWYAPAREDAPLAQAIAETRANASPSALEDVRGIPLDLQRALVPIVRALAAAKDEIEAARRGSSPELVAAASRVPSWVLGIRTFEMTAAIRDGFERIDVARITRAAAALALVVESADLARFAGMDIPSIDLSTSVGRIVLRGPSNDTFEDEGEAPALLLDTGGNDTYLGAVASGTPDQPASVLVDLGGRDAYAYAAVSVPADGFGKRLPSDGAGRTKEGPTLSRTGRQGSGVLGVGLLFDYGTDADSYRSLVASQGVGSHGVGVLFDAGGDDRYESEGFSQGAAAWGAGLLLDASGDDHYTLYNSGQGFGFTRAVGTLVDRAGDDIYVANPGDESLDGDILYPSDQLLGPPSSSVAGNHSFSQGCGAGHRPDWPDPGFPFPGGIGVLRDASGSDRYVAGVFAQGIGFVQGLGMVLEGAGDDTYEGLYYVQGAAAHMALALFSDSEGADLYNPTFPIQLSALALANDLSIAIHHDAGGDDRYRAPALSLGTGLANGLALFINDGGDDAFDGPTGAAFGVAHTSDVRDSRKKVPTVGVFVKARGIGTYTIDDKSDPRGGRHWCEGNEDDKIERSVGLDAPKGRARL